MADKTFVYTGIPQTFQIPYGVYSIIVECWGNGAAGQAGTPGNNTAHTYGIGGHGGGGGAYAKKLSMRVEPNKIYTIPAINLAPGEAQIWFTGEDSETCSAQCADNTGIGGQAASSIGDIVYSGGNGGTTTIGVSSYSASSGGGGGGGAGTTGAGGLAGNGSIAVYNPPLHNGPVGGSAGIGHSNGGGNGGKGTGYDASAGGIIGYSGTIYGGGGGGGWWQEIDGLYVGNTTLGLTGHLGKIDITWGPFNPKRSISGGAAYNYPVFY